jgi:thymidylate synthase
MFKGYPANLNAILWMVSEEFLEPAGFRLNAFRALADNCHIYSEDWDDARRIIRIR